MADIPALIARNAQRWKDAKLTRGPEFAPVARRLSANRERYQAIADKTDIPYWQVVAVIHEREAGYDPHFKANIAQGDPWNEKSTHHPAGRGPFQSWEDAAYDALVNCAPYAARNKDWSAGGTLTLLERYNGLAYANAGVPSPYIWSGTDQYKIGKVTRDHGPIEPVVDKQLGCAGLLMAMGVTFDVAIPPPPDIPAPQPAPTPTSFWQELIAAALSIFTQLFRRK